MQDPTTDVSAYMHWDSSGKLLIIPDEEALVENVCKVHFAQKSITSFVRLAPDLRRLCTMLTSTSSRKQNKQMNVSLLKDFPLRPSPSQARC